MKRSGFTMIELIFVIVILGILAAVAIPRLAATRDDARVSTELTNVSTCINDVGSQYTGSGREGDRNLSSCMNIRCFSLNNRGNIADGNISIDANVTNGVPTAGLPTFCTEAINRGVSQELNGTHTFGGRKVTF